MGAGAVGLGPIGAGDHVGLGVSALVGAGAVGLGPSGAGDHVGLGVSALMAGAV